MKHKIVTISFCLFFISIILSQSTQNNRELRIAIEGDFDIFSPWETSYTIREKVLWNIFEPLVALEEKSTKVKPYLATSWKASNNNRIWTLKLREGVKFHDGSILSADDVVASSTLFQMFEGKVEKIDHHTIRFILKEPHSGFLNMLAKLDHAIAPASTIRQYKSLKREGELKKFIPIGSGPFKYSQHEKGKQIILESFTDYWQEAPWLVKVIYRVITNQKEHISALEKGEVDVIDVMYAPDLSRLKGNPNLNMISIYGMNVCYIAMNTLHEPLNNLKVRRALNLAVDKMELTRKFLYGGYGVPTNRVLSPAFWGFSALPSPSEYRPAQAKNMLSDAGFKNGFSLKLVCAPGPGHAYPDPEGISKEIKNQFASIGVTLQIVLLEDWSEFLAALEKDDYDMVLVSWIDTSGDPDYTLTPLLSGKLYEYNDAHWQNKQFDEKLKAARELPHDNIRGRIRLYNEAQKIFQEDAPWIPLFHTKIFVIHKKNIQGIILYPSSMISYYKVKF